MNDTDRQLAAGAFYPQASAFSPAAPTQQFVDALNAKTMPALGYVFRNERWEWPNYLTGYWETRTSWDGPLISTGERINDGNEAR